ncbi:molecular chaperone DnaJ [bacterium]|nr:molecular chaperone DnaJ [bacterium]
MSDYYEILGVDKNATKEEIKSAFRQKARQLHPDVNKAPDAEEKFKELGKAYDTLSDDNKRATYDRYGEDGLQNAGFDTSGPFAGGFGDLNDIFESFFGGAFGFGGGRATNPNSPQNGADLRLNLEIEFEEAVFGVKKEIKISHLETCDECGGTGAQKGSKPETCSTCGGTGRVQQIMKTPLGSLSQVTTCPNCHGTGKIISNPCNKCHGDGRLEVQRTLHINIPAGVDNGSRIGLSNEGNCGKNGGRTGDLIVVIYVKEHPEFKRDGFDIYSKLEISFPQAALGDTIEVNTIDGKRELVIPAGVEQDKILQIKGAGVPNLGNSSKRGNHNFVVKIKTPQSLSAEEKQLYKKLFEINCNKKPSSKFIDKMKNVLHN